MECTDEGFRNISVESIMQRVGGLRSLAGDDLFGPTASLGLVKQRVVSATKPGEKEGT